MRIRFPFASMAVALVMTTVFVHAQEKKTLVFDSFHGQNARNAEVFNELLPADGNTLISVSSATIDDASLKDKKALIVFSPTKPFSENEKKSIFQYLRAGGSMLLIFDEERRTPLEAVGVNDLIQPFGMSLTENAPVRHNCGAKAEKSPSSYGCVLPSFLGPPTELRFVPVDATHASKMQRSTC